MARLVVADGSSYEVAGREMLLGRGERELHDPPKLNVGHLRGSLTVSRRHARLREHVGRWYLGVEPASTNPTMVDGFLVPKGTEVPLADGSRIQIGEVLLVFRGVSAPAPGGEMTIMPENGRAAHPSQPIVTVAAPPMDAAPPAAEGWVGRLPPPSPSLASIGLEPLRRVNPFRGLMIDETTWAEAHDYHRAAARLHGLITHGWGIVDGLDVLADPATPNGLLVRPGVALDTRGQVLFLPTEVRLTTVGQDGQVRYVVARYAEETTEPQRAWSDEEEHTRIVERCQIAIERATPVGTAVELARIVVAPTVRDALDPTLPRDGELDLRFRERLPVRPRPELAVAQLLLGGDTAASAPTDAALHRLGLRFLLREIALSTPYRARWAGVAAPDEPIPPVALLYLAGTGEFPVDDALVQSIGAFLGGGGILLADPCGDDEARVGAVRALTARLSIALEPVTRWHPLLTARHVLPGLPTGLELHAGGGIALASGDLGCAWQGGPLDRPAGREVVRAALELGTNVAVHARQRQRPLELLELEG
jgi:pSer/pThr/pTyr-binding forkhead associated (FHA) protein